MKRLSLFTISKKGLLMLSIAAIASGAMAQEASENEKDNTMEEVIEVKGYRGSLLTSTNAKRESNGFVDEVFADDIGKMPSLNLAESLARIPGVKIGREVTGEGQQISVRGLGSEFTKIALNGNSISIASTGNINANNNGRQVDLDMFPTELFSGLSVAKTATAGQIEGGVSGYVNMRTARASDMGDGQNIRFSLEGDYKDTTGKTSPKAAFTYSFSNETFGALFTIVGKQGNNSVDGYETVGNIAQTGCLAAAQGSGCRYDGEAGTFRYTDIASADYVTANGGNVGDVIDYTAEAGLSDAQIYGLGMPYIGRLMNTHGKKNSVSALLSLQYSPNEDMELVLDMINANSENDFIRTEFMHIYRRNYDNPFILSNISVVDNGNGSRLDSGTFYGSKPWIGSRQYQEDLSFQSIMPSFSWIINDNLKLDLSASKTKSDFERDEPYGLYYVSEGTLTVANDGIVPTVKHNNLNDYTNYAWQSLRFGHKERQTDTTGFHADLEWGENARINGIIFGISSDEMVTKQQEFSADDLNAHLDANGLSTVQADMGSFITPVEFGSSIDGYQGLNGFGGLNWGKFKNAINYDNIANSEGNATHIAEKVTAIYFEVNSETEVAGRMLRTNGGLRHVTTDQYVATLTGETNEKYTRLLPSFSAVYDVMEDVKVRASASRSLTRANPAHMFPNSVWSGSGIDAISTGNPTLSPFESTNFDIGGEWYFSDMGYVGLTYYTKDITGFTLSSQIPVNFNDLGEWGMETTGLSQTQQDQLSICSPDCIVNVNTRDNTRGVSTLTGVEVIWVQPLDFIIDGLGFNASANKIKDESAKEADEIPGISDSYNFTIYYENEEFQTRVTYYHQDGADEFDSWGSPVIGRDRAQIDLSATYNLPLLQQYNLTLTFDAYNLTNEEISDYIENDSSQTFNAYYPGATYNFGVRGSF